MYERVTERERVCVYIREREREREIPNVFSRVAAEVAVAAAVGAAKFQCFSKARNMRKQRLTIQTNNIKPVLTTTTTTTTFS